MTLFLIAYLGALAVAALPRWDYNRNWGYYPCSAIMMILGTVIGVSLVY
ncbi:MAG TPA: DUF3309 family protein [Rhizomicrobium sp.]|jgi:hypothetical protein|nr:DUF3309 family protein [Rhizomicrobium sp.]